MEIMSQFNLPTYVKGKSFSEASALIAKRFQDRTSPEDIATLNDLQGRLQQAQEFVKAEQEKRTKPQDAPAPEQAPGQNEFNLGGAMGAATTALDLGQQAFGDTGIDTSGATAAPEVQSQGMSTASGALKGASAGASFGPWGAAIGGVVGGVAGLIGGGKAERDAQEAAVNFTSGQQNQASNSYKSGGQLLANSFRTGGDTDPVNDVDGIDYSTAVNKNRVVDPVNPVDPRAKVDYTGEMTAKGYDVEGLGMKDSDIGKYNTGNTLLNSLNAGQDASNSALESGVVTSNVTKTSTGQDNNASIATDMLRYAPAAMNMAQLANLKKPEGVALNRLGNKYNEQRVDERGMQNSVQESVNNNRDAILSSSGGSGSTARSNLLASQLQGSKAMSGAYQAATGENRQDNVRGQQFDLGVDQANLGQSNNETNLNLEQQAAYQTNKSKLLSQIGNDLGGVGKEEMMKKYPELMGMNYDWKGRHKSTKKKKK